MEMTQDRRQDLRDVGPPSRLQSALHKMDGFAQNRLDENPDRHFVGG
jgi:hypothetical protein